MTHTATADDNVTDQILAEVDRLKRRARRMTRCEADADDLVQETVLRAFRARSRFEEGTSMTAWTSTIMRRVVLTDAMRAKRRATRNDTDAGEPLERAPDLSWDNAGGVPTYANLVERLEDRVKHALDLLPEYCKAPFLFSVVGDLSCAEIAARLRIPKGTVMSRIHRARERMKSRLVYGGQAGASAA
jgi:RNA polymerase sigma-70 factor (ECF subfamily)